MKRISLTWMCWMSAALVGCAQAGPLPAVAERTSKPLGAMASAIAQTDYARFKRADRNGDGQLSAPELAPMPAEAIALLDQDGNGTLSFKEAIAQAPTTSARARVALEFEEALEASGEAPNAGLAEALLEDAAEAPPPVAPGPAKLNPVVLVPGYLDFEFFFHVIRKKLLAQGRTVVYLDLWPNMGDIKVKATALKNTVAELKAKTGARQVDVIGHSMGGLITRYYIQELGGLDQLERLITLATPHHGTIVSYLGPSKGASQMHPGSDFLKALNANDESPGPIKYTSIRAGLDEIVIPHSSPIQEGAENHLARFAMHGTIFIDKTAWKHLDEALRK